MKTLERCKVFEVYSNFNNISYRYKMASRYLDSVPLPTELPIVLNKLIKAILRDQPQDIIQYCAVYFENMQVD